MELNLLFLPLLGGYIFYCRWNATRFHAARCDGQRILFHAAFFGLILLTIARALVLATPWIASHQEQLVRVAAYVTVAAIVALLGALGYVAVESRRDAALKEELGSQKPAAGLLIASIGLAALGMLFKGALSDEWLESAGIAALCSLILAGASLALAYFMRADIRNLETRLYEQFRLSALFLRIALLSTLFALCTLIWVTAPGDLSEGWSAFSPYANSGTPFLACMIGALLWWPLNLVFPFQVANARLYRHLKTNSLERLLYRAATDTSTVQVSLHDGKVYVGFVAASPPDPSAPDAYIQVLPTMSGYRHSDTKQIVFTTFYDEIYEDDDSDPEDFVKVLPIAQIESAGPFREDIYLKFLNASSPTHQPEVPGTA